MRESTNEEAATGFNFQPVAEPVTFTNGKITRTSEELTRSAYVQASLEVLKYANPNLLASNQVGIGRR